MRGGGSVRVQPVWQGLWFDGRWHTIRSQPRLATDGSAEMAKKLGLELDLTARGMGVRATRFSMLVENGVVKSVNLEPNPGEAEASGAEAMLGQV